MSAPPYMKLYVAEWTADTQALTCEQDGAYGRIVRAMWRAGGSLQNDPTKLARIAGVLDKRWAEIGADVVALFICRGKTITHKRLKKEVAKYKETVAKRKEAGAKGGVKSGANRRKRKVKSVEANAIVLLEQNRSNCRHNQNQNHRNKNSAPTEQRVLIPSEIAVACEADAAPPISPEETAARAQAQADLRALAAQIGKRAEITH